MFLAAPKEPVCLPDWEGSGGTSWGVPIYRQILEWGLRPFLCGDGWSFMSASVFIIVCSGRWCTLPEAGTVSVSLYFRL